MAGLDLKNGHFGYRIQAPLPGDHSKGGEKREKCGYHQGWQGRCAIAATSQYERTVRHEAVGTPPGDGWTAARRTGRVSPEGRGVRRGVTVPLHARRLDRFSIGHPRSTQTNVSD